MGSNGSFLAEVDINEPTIPDHEIPEWAHKLPVLQFIQVLRELRQAMLFDYYLGKDNWTRDSVQELLEPVKMTWTRNPDGSLKLTGEDI